MAALVLVSATICPVVVLENRGAPPNGTFILCVRVSVNQKINILKCNS